MPFVFNLTVVPFWYSHVLTDVIENIYIFLIKLKGGFCGVMLTPSFTLF